MQSFKINFSDRNFLVSFFGGVLLLTISLIVQFFIIGYVNSLTTSPVTDIILSNIRVYDVSATFVYGSILLTIIGVIIGLRRLNCLPFAMKSVALFTLIRSIFVTLTHISPFPTHAVISLPFFLNNEAFSGIFTGNDLFFSGHTGLPFLLALIFWQYKTERTIFMGFSILFAVVVLLGHIHYSIDVLSAYFITYSIFQICKFLFKKEWGLMDKVQA